MTRDEILQALNGWSELLLQAHRDLEMRGHDAHPRRAASETVKAVAQGIAAAKVKVEQERDALAAEIAALRTTLIGWVELGEEMRRILENDVLIADWFAPRLYAALARGLAPTRDPVTPGPSTSETSVNPHAHGELLAKEPGPVDTNPRSPVSASESTQVE